MRRKTKYTLRKDGTIEMVKTMPDGKRKHFYGHSDDEVESKYTEALNALKGDPKCHTFEYFADAWWEKKEKTISPNSKNNYRIAKKRAVDEFGDKLVCDITPQDVYTYLSTFVAQGFSQKVIGMAKLVVKGILDDAFVAKEIQVNPCLSIPQAKGKGKEQRQPAKKSDLKLIEEHKFDSNIARMFYFMAYTGLRRGEAVALQYKHIDRKRKTVRVEQSCAWDNSTPILKKPKTSAGIRTVDLLDNALEAIPKGHKPDEYIFFPDGLPRRGIIDTQIRHYYRDTGVSATPHQLRHSYASLLHSAGVDVKDAQVLLGHSTVTLTQDIYTHLEDEHKKDVRNKLNKYVQKRLS